MISLNEWLGMRPIHTNGRGYDYYLLKEVCIFCEETVYELPLTAHYSASNETIFPTLSHALVEKAVSVSWQWLYS